MKNILLPLLMALSMGSYGQYSGYLGKRLSLHWDFATSPSLLEPNRVNTEPRHSTLESAGSMSFNTRHAFDLEWAVNKSFSTGVLCHSIRTRSYVTEGYDILEPVETGLYESELANSNVEVSNGNVAVYSLLNAFSYGIHTTFYLDDLNPLGTFLKFEFFRTRYKLKDVEYYKSGSPIKEVSLASYEKPFIDDKYHTYGLTCILGKQKVYFNQVLVRYGIQVGYVFDSASDGYGLDIVEKERLNATNAVYRKSNKRLLNHYLFNFEFGLGYLLY